MFTTADIDTVAGGDVYGNDLQKIGSVGQIYLDNDTDRPEWVTVKTGLFGTKETFVPLADATVSDGNVHVPYGKEKVKDAPRIDADGALSPAEEDELYAYYGVGLRGELDSGSGHTDTLTAGTEGTGVAGIEESDRSSGVVGHDTSGPTTDEAMTRSEEQLRVGTRTEESGRARLRKYVVTEQQTRSVPVSHEEVTIEREPITEANAPAATDGPTISEEEHEVVLHAEKPVVEKEVTPIERIKLGTETVQEERTVTEDVRKEQVELDDDTGKSTSR
ncbi:DUF2382 domain-containing protein [Rhodococcoides kroppenstedtii]|uniref:DUF2382 domain-containing protein n=1 Tax=Rhodococcoides kroppenstedtii TaxID=293050 RepID=UPI001BDEE460|nr:PRC and DUF2382 domain-containing protein [Rhodococcus kroppenstedtii]MBT1193880.1 PRC and DUF2382 domain-containing protein [Rhodococcus kroppenstedtii]